MPACYFTEHFMIDLVATVLIVYVLYYRRHGRRDLLMPYLAFNVGLFLVLTMLSLHQTGLGIGIGPLYPGVGASPYRQQLRRYFGAAAGPAGKGYYSYTLGAWHVIALNAECSEVACDRGSAQERWLRRDLAAHPVRCTLAIWHQPRFSSGKGDDDKTYAPFWDDLYAAGADVVINGHVHAYERFAPQDPKGHADPRRGIREFIVGTGGAHLRQKRRDVDANSQVLHLGTWGVLKLTLAPANYRWQFIPVKGQTFTDAGSAACH